MPSGREYNEDSSFNYSRDTADQKLSYGYSASNDDYSYQNSEAFNISNSYHGLNTMFSWNQSQSLLGTKWVNVHDTLHHDQSLFTDDAKLSVDADYYSYKSDSDQPTQAKLQPRINFSYRGAFYSLNVVQDMHINYNDAALPDKSSYVERLPEATLAFDPLDMYYFNLNMSLDYTRKHEAQYFSATDSVRNFTTGIYSLNGVASRRDLLGFGTVLSTSLGLRQYAYDTGDQRYSVDETANLNTGLWGFFRNSMNWARTKVDGNTPFFTETLGSEREFINDTISLYYMDKLSFDLYAGYNYQNSTYDDIKGNLRFAPDEKFNCAVSSGWSVENQDYLPLSASFTWVPLPNFTNTGSLQYDLNASKLIGASSLVDLEWGNTWEDHFHFKMSHYYDLSSERYLLQQIAVTKDLHCWEASFS